MRQFHCVLTLLGFLCLISDAVVTGEDSLIKELAERLAQVEQTVKHQQTLLKEQRDEITFLKTQKTSHGKKSNAVGGHKRFVMDTEGPIAFTSLISPKVVEHVHHNDIIQFETVLTNFGGAYNNDSGIFVVPIAGIYLISCSILDSMKIGGHGSVMVHGEIMKNHQVLARVFAHAENLYRDQGTNTIIVQLNVGDQIFVRTVDNNDLGLGGELYTSFSGYLLWQM